MCIFLHCILLFLFVLPTPKSSVEASAVKELVSKFVARPDGVFVEITLINDGSASISSVDWASMREINIKLASKVNSNVKLSVLTFSNSVTELFPHTLLESKAVSDQLVKIIEGNFIQPRQSTATDEALLASIPKFSINAEKYVYLLTDGMPNYEYKFVDAAKQLKARGIHLISIMFSAPLDAVELLKANSEMAESVSSMGELVKIFDRELRSPECDLLELSIKPSRYNFEFSDVFTADLFLSWANFLGKRTGMIEKGMVLEIREEVRVPGQPHFKRYLKRIDNVDDLTGESTSFQLELRPEVNANADTLPERLTWKLFSPQKRVLKCEAHFFLSTEYFSGSLRSELNQFTIPINVMLVGPMGNGKTTVLRAIRTCFKTNYMRDLSGATGATADKHTTVKYESYNLTTSEGVSITLWDGKGMDATNYKEGYIAAMLEGKIPSGHEEREDLEAHKKELSDAKINPARIIHGIIFVVSMKIIGVPDAEIQYVRNALQTMKQKGYNVVIAVTHWDTRPATESGNELMDKVLHHLGMAGNAFPISAYPKITHRMFETDIQTLQMLSHVVRSAKSFILQNMPENIKRSQHICVDGVC